VAGPHQEPGQVAADQAAANDSDPHTDLFVMVNNEIKPYFDCPCPTAVMPWNFQAVVRNQTSGMPTEKSADQRGEVAGKPLIYSFV
jgi:hypothetical protein